MTERKKSPPPVRNPSSPNFKVPRGACDTHFHIFGPYDRFPLLENRSMDLEECTLENLLSLHDVLGIERGVIVQSVMQGHMTEHLVDALERYPERFRAIAIPSTNLSDVELERLTKAGVVGVRFAYRFSSQIDLNLIDRLHEFGWHPQFWFRGEEEALSWSEKMKSVPGNFVIDHMGWQPADKGCDSPGFRVVLDCLDTGRCWVKLSGPGRFSKEGWPEYRDVLPMAKLLAERAPERLLWGSDWPHPDYFKKMPDDGKLLDLMLDWVTDEKTRNQIFVENPAELFGFGPLT
jgi:2-pyrone-4,6-dicarboxylate lactonase